MFQKPNLQAKHMILLMEHWSAQKETQIIQALSNQPRILGSPILGSQLGLQAGVPYSDISLVRDKVVTNSIPTARSQEQTPEPSCSHLHTKSSGSHIWESQGNFPGLRAPHPQQELHPANLHIHISLLTRWTSFCSVEKKTKSHCCRS